MKKIISFLLMICIGALMISGCFDEKIDYFVGSYTVTKCQRVEYTTYWGKSSNYSKIDFLKGKNEITIEIKDNGEVIYDDGSYNDDIVYLYEIKKDKIKLHNTIVENYWLEKKEKDGVITLEYSSHVELDNGSKVDKKVTDVKVVLTKN